MSEPSSAPDRYAVVGHPIEHSRSPLIHAVFAKQTGENITYGLIDATPAELEVAVRGFAAAGGRGLNITIPHKEAAFALCRIHGKEAQAAGAVNTITFTKAGIRGDNTDGIGFIRDLTENNDCEIAGRRILVLGAGGAARGIVGPILDRNPGRLIIANRTLERAESLREELESPAVLEICRFDELAQLQDIDVIVNATSAGLNGELPPFPGSLVAPGTFCYDLVYGSSKTPFVVWSEQHGARQAVQGWGMLIEQAAESFFIWRGKRPDTTALRAMPPGLDA
jgi:shikimate dehydrogenase